MRLRANAETKGADRLRTVPLSIRLAVEVEMKWTYMKCWQ